MAWLKTRTAFLVTSAILLAFCVYEIVIASMMLTKIANGNCSSTSELFVLQLVASIVTIAMAVMSVLRSEKLLKFRYLFTAVVGILRTWIAITVFLYADQNVGMCYVDPSFATWLILQQVLASMFLKTCLEFLRGAQQNGNMMLF